MEKRTRKRSAKRKPSGPPKTAEAQTDQAAREAFVSGLVSRGEAVETSGGLPPGATHEIVGHDASGKPEVKRRRFSAM